jgi:hypothetical protein
MPLGISRAFRLVLIGLVVSAVWLTTTEHCYSAGDFDVTIDVSRTDGVAPLSVFFDATGTPDLADGTYVDATFAWNFDTEYVSAYERPGPVIVAACEDPDDPSDQAPIIYNTGMDSAWATITPGDDWRIMDVRIRTNL